MSADRFAKLCDLGCTHGDFSYVANALRANHEGTEQFFEGSMARGNKKVDEGEAYSMLQMSYKTSALLLSLITRIAFMESESGKLAQMGPEKRG